MLKGAPGHQYFPTSKTVRVEAGGFLAAHEGGLQTIMRELIKSS